MEQGGPRAWLLMAAGANRGHGGNAGYDDLVDAYYSWDSHVPNHKNLRVGDPVALWDKERLLGVSVIEQIETSAGLKVLHRCPACSTTRIRDRRTRAPRYRCARCRHEFGAPVPDVVEVVQYLARYDAAWTALEGTLDGTTLRALAVNEGDFNAMRPLEWRAFRDALVAAGASRAVDRLSARVDLSWSPPGGEALVGTSHGFARALVRVRRGQQRFREQLLAAQGSVCAFTGGAPARVLEAGHLYSYARLGEHLRHGGFMLRRDIHRLFDDGMLAVHPSTLRVDVAPQLDAYPQYAQLHDRPLTLQPEDGQVEWLGKHWVEHRAAFPDPADGPSTTKGPLPA